MSNINTGGPAFPRPASDAHQHGMHKPQEGMTLRDYFAAKVLQGIFASGPATYMTNERIVAEAYEMADAMLKARE